VVLCLMGIAPGYPRLAIATVLLFGAIYWLSRRSGKKAKTGE
jgi:flagellar biosynthesis component FlhA